MFDIIEIAADLMEGWHSRSRLERWLARGCGCIVFSTLIIIGIIIIIIVRQPPA